MHYAEYYNVSEQIPLFCVNQIKRAASSPALLMFFNITRFIVNLIVWVERLIAESAVLKTSSCSCIFCTAAGLLYTVMIVLWSWKKLESEENGTSAHCHRYLASDSIDDGLRWFELLLGMRSSLLWPTL